MYDHLDLGLALWLASEESSYKGYQSHLHFFFQKGCHSHHELKKTHMLYIFLFEPFYYCGLCRDANLLIGMPTTDVFIKSVEKRLHNLLHNSQLLSSDSLPSQEREGCAENVTVVDLLNDSIRELEPRKKYLKVHCRVGIYLSVNHTFVEWSIASTSWLYSLMLAQIVICISLILRTRFFCILVHSGCIRGRT